MLCLDEEDIARLLDGQEAHPDFEGFPIPILAEGTKLVICGPDDAKRLREDEYDPRGNGSQ